MSNNPIRVLVVDDSAVLREVISDFISETEGLSVAGTAKDGIDAIEKTRSLKPDIITLDVQMPRMDGLETLDKILSENPIPVIMVSALTQRQAGVTMQALDRGAVDYVGKPDNLNNDRDSFKRSLVFKLKNMASADVQRILRLRKNRAKRGPSSIGRDASSLQIPPGYETSCVAIGISTGGPRALSGIFQCLKTPLPPIVIVQHMPEQFTGPFSKRLDSMSQINVKEAETGDVLKPNHAIIAPGGKHLKLRKRGSQVSAQIVTGDPVSGHKPSVDVMMTDAAKIFGNRCLGVIMTGMGVDGVEGCAAVKQNGGYVYGQDEATSDVYGMNKAAFVKGHVDRQFRLDDLVRLMPNYCSQHFRSGARLLATSR